jgi:hypothetical protein
MLLLCLVRRAEKVSSTAIGLGGGDVDAVRGFRLIVSSLALALAFPLGTSG